MFYVPTLKQSIDIGANQIYRLNQIVLHEINYLTTHKAHIHYLDFNKPIKFHKSSYKFLSYHNHPAIIDIEHISKNYRKPTISSNNPVHTERLPTNIPDDSIRSIGADTFNRSKFFNDHSIVR